MILVDFCEKFDLTIFILQKLNILKVTEPHVLWFILNQQLVEVGGWILVSWQIYVMHKSSRDMGRGAVRIMLT